MNEEDLSQWEYRYPNYRIIWKAHHTWTDYATDRVDGFFLFPDDSRRQLDIASYADECCVIKEKEEAAAAWALGSVYLSQDHEAHGVDTLVVPRNYLTTELIHEALRRFRP